MTPLMLALLMVEIVDVVFTVDSVPSTFAITTDPFLVYTSNIFAILGLRALYFTLAAMVYRFRYLKYALSVLLVFVGSKIFLACLAGSDGGKFPLSWSLAITFAILTAGIVYSLWKMRGGQRTQTPGQGDPIMTYLGNDAGAQPGKAHAGDPLIEGTAVSTSMFVRGSAPAGGPSGTGQSRRRWSLPAPTRAWIPRASSGLPLASGSSSATSGRWSRPISPMLATTAQAPFWSAAPRVLKVSCRSLRKFGFTCLYCRDCADRMAQNQ
jgi:hypothetical protein